MVSASLPSPFTAAERELIRREFGMHFGSYPSLADGILLRTRRSGPQEGQPRIPAAVQTMLERGLVEVRPGRNRNGWYMGAVSGAGPASSFAKWPSSSFRFGEYDAPLDREEDPMCIGTAAATPLGAGSSLLGGDTGAGVGSGQSPNVLLAGLSPKQQDDVAAAAQDWSTSNVPYVRGGTTKAGADCSGAVSGIYSQAGIDIGHMTSQDFNTSPLFSPVAGPLQKGDVGVYDPTPQNPGHNVIYGRSLGKTSSGQDADVWSAFRPGGPVFGPANSSWFGTPHWYRYNGNGSDGK